ncbi:hypothetical protein AQEC111735_12075 [Aquirufa ecclesiirivi]
MGVKVNVPDPTVPENTKLEVKLATPEVKSPALFKIFVPDKPVIAPVKEVVTVTGFVEALNKEVLPYASCAVKVLVPVKATPLFCGLVKLTTSLLKVAAETTTLKRSAPVVVIPPCVATRFKVSAL